MKSFTKNTRYAIYSITGGKCFYCGCELDFENFHVDHFVPKANRGVDKNNRVPSCQDCNLVKADKSIEEFRKTIENYVYNDIHVRMIGKYNGIKRRKVKFYFEMFDFKCY